MNVTTYCPNCNAELTLDQQWVGHNVECPYCDRKFAFTGALDTAPRQRAPVPQRKSVKEYKVLTQKDKWFSGKFDPEKLEGAINAYARQGWRVVGCATASMPGILTENRDEMVVIMERDRN